VLKGVQATYEHLQSIQKRTTGKIPGVHHRFRDRARKLLAKWETVSDRRDAEVEYRWDLEVRDGIIYSRILYA